jgi:aldehyde:ferredoxin oxidoreductase
MVELQSMLDEYYQISGWDSQGRPTPEKLRKMGLA